MTFSKNIAHQVLHSLKSITDQVLYQQYFLPGFPLSTNISDQADIKVLKSTALNCQQNITEQQQFIGASVHHR